MRLPRLIGVIHLPPLAGAPRAGGHPSAVLQQAGLRAVAEAQLLARAGFDGLIVENFGDAPFYKNCVPPETVASLAIIAAAVREAVRIPIGINVLRNDPRAALAIAAVSGCELIRVNVLSGVTATDQGLIEGDAAALIRERARLQADDLRILADVHVKHGRSLSSDDLILAMEETALRGAADGVILTGATTGRPVDPAELSRLSEAARHHRIPLYIGSGATFETVGELLRLADGVIVGSDLRQGGRAGERLDSRRVSQFIRSARKPVAKKKGAKRRRKR